MIEPEVVNYEMPACLDGHVPKAMFAVWIVETYKGCYLRRKNTTETRLFSNYANAEKAAFEAIGRGERQENVFVIKLHPLVAEEWESDGT